ncbi:MAG: hypothetical protein NC452_19630 [Eubacterium sp.]|nr:hypothetical protein [Eubacterium sp.]
MSEVVCFICPKCSNYRGAQPSTKQNCHFCDIPMIETDVLLKDAFMNEEIEKPMKEKYAYNNPLYDEELDKQIKERVHIENKNTPPMNLQSPNVPKCPTCGSTNIKRISTSNRAVSIGLFGLLSGKIGKNYECRNCKAKW